MFGLEHSVQDKLVRVENRGTEVNGSDHSRVS